MEDRTILSLENLQVEAIKELADYIVKEKHADYLFTVKRNQESLMNDIDALRLESFPPHHVSLDKAHGRVEA